MNTSFFLKSLVLIGIFIILGLYYSFSHQEHIALTFDKIKTIKAKSGFTFPTPLPSLTPTPTTIPTPTPEPLVGFCQKIPIIFYHHIEPSNVAAENKTSNLNVDAGIFETQMKYLNDNGYKNLSAEELVSALTSKQQLGKAVVVTLDDGYEDNYIYAYPIAKKYNMKLSLMIPTGLMANSGYLSWDQLKEMKNSGLVFAYNHTWSHYSAGGSNTEKIDWEIVTAQKQLDDNLGKTGRIFAYPYGSYGQNVINILIREGFSGAFSTVPGQWQCDSFIYRLHRIRIGNAPLSFYGI